MSRIPENEVIKRLKTELRRLRIIIATQNKQIFSLQIFRDNIYALTIDKENTLTEQTKKLETCMNECLSSKKECNRLQNLVDQYQQELQQSKEHYLEMENLLKQQEQLLTNVNTKLTNTENKYNNLKGTISDILTQKDVHIQELNEKIYTKFI